MNNAAVEKIVAKEKALGDQIKFEDIIEEVAGVYPKVMIDGDVNAGAWSLVASPIHDIPTCDELVNRIVKDAEDIIRGRLFGL
jgi:nitronate monooxygenase